MTDFGMVNFKRDLVWKYIFMAQSFSPSQETLKDQRQSLVRVTPLKPSPEDLFMAASYKKKLLATFFAPNSVKFLD